MKIMYTPGKLFIVMAAVILSEAAWSQQATEKQFPAQLTFIYPLGIFGHGSKNYTYNFSINALTGYTGNIRGIEAGGLLNMNNGSVSGFQAGGIGNITAGWFTGMQAGGIFSLSAGMNGMQTGGLFCKSGAVHGLQLAGLLSLAKSSDVMISGLANISQSDLKGIQIGGIFNKANNCDGLQLGLINVTDTTGKGISIGLINIPKKGFFREWSLSTADYLHVGFSFKAGSQSFYNIYTVGINFIGDQLWAAGIGFGHLSNAGRNFAFQPEVICYTYFPRDFRHVRDTYTAHIRFGIVRNLNESVSVSLSPGVYWALKSDRGRYTGYGYEQTMIEPVFATKRADSNSRIETGFGCSLAISFR